MKVGKDVKYRDTTIHSYILSRNWDKKPEFLLNREVFHTLKAKKPELSDFIYVYDYESEEKPCLSNKGKVDLIITKKNNKYLIIECTSRNLQEVRQ